MTDKKLTDQEIIKRLEIASCIDAVRNDALDLIKRLQAKVEFYKKNRDKYQDDVMYLSKQCDELQAENERLKKENQCLSELEQGCYVTGYKKITAEAYKECIEKVKNELSFGKYITAKQLDNLLKELVGDANA